MKLRIKMTLLFSAMMLIALGLLSSYAATTSIEGSNAFTEARFRNMSTSITRDLEQDFSMMDLTLRELTDSTSFMAALNQLIRDDSADQKMALAAGKAALNQLLQSPLVENYFRVSFYTRDGIFLTSRVDRTPQFASGTVQARTVLSSLPWLEQVNQATGITLLEPHNDLFIASENVSVYGIVRKISYKGIPLGYLEISQRTDSLSRLNDFIDNSSVSAQILFPDGRTLYASDENLFDWPTDIPENTFTTVTLADGSSRMVYCREMDSLGIRLIVSQDSSVQQFMNQAIWRSILRRALLIMMPTILLIALLSLNLTRSIRNLTRKMRQVPADSMLTRDGTSLQALSTDVTSPRDQETHELEQVFNKLMTRLRESANNELSLREGTLQAQLKALQTQINPHFVYNTLNIISAKSMESGNYDVIEICDQFAQMLRYSTDTRSRTATMAEEIENVRNYLLLAKARYEENLEYVINVPENLSTVTVPKLTLQPIVENALNHGFDGINVQRTLSITGEIKNQQLLLVIRDNGTGFSPDTLERLQKRLREIEAGQVSIDETAGHIGLTNTCLRLYYYSHGAMHISLHNDHGAVVSLSMPMKEK